MELEQIYLDKGKDYTPRTQHLDKQGRAKFVNHLILESSPYLLQHAHNPVNWYPFSDEAFDKAKAENKPIFISIGYATCHWCHVMEEESFDDVEVAKFLNKHFIS
ncbi:MAG TPA: thioredoxin, partial [Gammaproteobacteria bacterium]|nr:thioredoxin [Gammaproteobacteria bacterium]HAO97532.1 thioredoxin [Gammaproteobacteria bacterium]